MYWIFGRCPGVTWTAEDQCRPSVDVDNSTGSSTPGPLAFHTANICPVVWSPSIIGRQHRMSAGPPPMLWATTDGLVQEAPPSEELRATSDTPLPCRRMKPCRSPFPITPFPSAWPAEKYTSVITPFGWTKGWESWVNWFGEPSMCVLLQVRPLLSDQRTTWGDAPLARNSVQNW